MRIRAECRVCFFWPSDAGQAFLFVFVRVRSLGCVQDGRRTGRDGRCWEVVMGKFEPYGVRQRGVALCRSEVPSSGEHVV